jgi:hypothetical protein
VDGRQERDVQIEGTYLVRSYVYEDRSKLVGQKLKVVREKVRAGTWSIFRSIYVGSVHERFCKCSVFVENFRAKIKMSLCLTT